MAVPVVLHSISFQNKSQARRFFSDMLNRYNLGEDVCSEDFLHLNELLLRHPEFTTKIRHGVSSIRVQSDGYGRRCFWIIGEREGQEVDFSIKTCIDAAHRPLAQQISAACRTAVRPHLRQLREDWFDARGGVSVCSESGVEINMQNSVVDHMPPRPFSTIVAGFMATIPERDLNESLLESGETSGTVTRFADENMSQRFLEFHNRMTDGRIGGSTLRVIHSRANNESSAVGRVRRDSNII
jgi:hypothetical protein